MKVSILNEMLDIKIREVQYVEWDEKSVDVAARPFHALVSRLKGDTDFIFPNFKCSVYKEEILLLPKGYSYNATYKNKTEMLVIHFDSSLDLKPEVFHVDNIQIISSLFYKMNEIWISKNTGYYFGALSLMCEILENLSLRQVATKKENLDYFYKAVEYLELNYTSCDLTVDELVKKAYMSNTYFRKLFYEKYGTTPMDYIIKKRLSYAEKLLAKGDVSIAEAAYMSGFRDSKYFSRMIKKEYGVPPSKLYTIKSR